MEYNDFLSMNTIDLRSSLITYVMTYKDAAEILTSLKSEPRYFDDYVFRATVDTAYATLLSIQNRFLDCIPLCADLIERTTVLELWDLLSTNLNMLGGVYHKMQMVERAIECYIRAINVETKHTLNIVLPSTYYNIALIYYERDDFQNAIRFLEQGIRCLELAGERLPRYQSRIINNKSMYAQLLYMTDKIEEADRTYEELFHIDMEHFAVETRYTFASVGIYYAYHTGDPEKLKTAFLYAKNQIEPGGAFPLLKILDLYVNFCEKLGLNFDEYKEEILAVRDFEPVPSYQMEAIRSNLLRKYYFNIGDEEHFDRFTEEYIKNLQKFNTQTIREQLVSINSIVSMLLNKEEDPPKTADENMEFKLIAEEATKAKIALEATNHQIETIIDLGRKLTQSTNLEEVISAIYLALKERLYLDTFMLLVAEPENRLLRSVAVFYNNKTQDEFTIRMDEKESIFADCYRNNTIKVINQQSKIKLKKFYDDEVSDMSSAIFMPLNVGDQIIGMCSVQSAREEVYREEEIKFLEQLLPFLAIALNNASKSWALEREIQQRKDIQIKLENANHILERISSLDGLTQISSRRDFESRFLSLLDTAIKGKREIAVYMVDIDNFKLYNDTYGHLEGDEVLKKVARIFRKHMDRINGLSARFGGEEFIGACAGLSKEEYEKVGRAFCEEIYKLNIPNEKAPLPVVSISVGVVTGKVKHRKEKSVLMKLADDALYEAKRSGKNRTVVKSLENLPPNMCEKCKNI